MRNRPKAGCIVIVSALRPPLFNLVLSVDAEPGHNVKFSDFHRRDSQQRRICPSLPIHRRSELSAHHGQTM